MNRRDPVAAFDSSPSLNETGIKRLSHRRKAAIQLVMCMTSRSIDPIRLARHDTDKE
jgi:hypothetical protein